MTASRDIWEDVLAQLQACHRREVDPMDAFDDLMWRHRGERPKIPDTPAQKSRKRRFPGLRA